MRIYRTSYADVDLHPAYHFFALTHGVCFPFYYLCADGANDLLSASQRPLEFDLFYNDVLCESIDARNEFLQWKIEKE